MDLRNIEEYIAAAQSLASDPSNSSDSTGKHMCDSVMVSIGLAQLRTQKEPSFDVVAHAPGSGKYTSKFLGHDKEKLRDYVLKKQEGLKLDLENSVLNEQAHEDLQNLLSCVGKSLCGFNVYLVTACQLRGGNALHSSMQAMFGIGFWAGPLVKLIEVCPIILQASLCSFVHVETDTTCTICKFTISVSPTYFHAQRKAFSMCVCVHVHTLCCMLGNPN